MTKKGMEPLPFGHVPDVAVNIEGLEVRRNWLYVHTVINII